MMKHRILVVPESNKAPVTDTIADEVIAYTGAFGYRVGTKTFFVAWHTINSITIEDIEVDDE